MYITVDTTQKPNQKTKLADLKTYVPYKSFKLVKPTKEYGCKSLIISLVLGIVNPLVL